MSKKLLIVLLIILLPVLVWGRGVFQGNEGTKTSCLSDDSTSVIDLSEHNNFGVRFQITTPDTSKSDSMTVYLQGSHNKTTWENLYTFAKYVADTTTKYKFFPLDSLLAYKFDRYVRLKISTTGIATTDTGASEILQPTGNGTTLGWGRIGAGADTTRWGVINETTFDSTDFDSTNATAKWLVVSCANHAKNELPIDSVKMFVRGGYYVDTCAFRFGITLADTATAMRSFSDSTVMTAGATGTYTKNFTTSPHGTTWSWVQLDSLGMIFKTVRVKTSAAVKIPQAYLVVYYNKGLFSPALLWKVNWILKD